MHNPEHIRILLQLCRRLYDKGLVGGSGGNVSLRSGDGILITPTGRNLGLLEEEDIVRLRLDGETVMPNMGPFDADIGQKAYLETAPRPSQERLMHCRCYRREDVGCVVHVHSVYAVALACLPLDPLCAMPVYTPGYAVQVGRLPVAPYFRPGSQELAEYAGRIIDERNSVLLANHGVLTVGANAEQALNIAEEIEENAHIFCILNGKGTGLTEAQQAELLGRY